jgi:DNA-binding FrmR family transcriptional regulator
MRSHQHIEDVINRLSRTEGHIRGIKQMLIDGKPCDEILIQFSAVRSALDIASKKLLEDHLEHCVLGKTKDKVLRKELTEFKKALYKFLK